MKRAVVLAAAVLAAACDDAPVAPRHITSLVATVPINPNYGIHDTYVRDGLAFVSAWNSGVLIYDVGNGIEGGSPADPRYVSTAFIDPRGVHGGMQVHNVWWFHDPVSLEQRYLFVGQEGPGIVGGGTSGDIHVVDVSDLHHPVEVAFYTLTGAGTHNFWMDEANRVLYAAYYNGGVVALDVAGTLSGDLAPRLAGRVVPGGAAYVWGVMVYNGSVYASDMLSGFWQLQHTPSTFGVVSGGANVPARFSSDLWISDGYAYTGTWGQRAALGNTVNVWRIEPSGAPVLADSVITTGITTVSDIEVSPDGSLLMFSSENGPREGLHFYRLPAPGQPVFVQDVAVPGGAHTATFAVIGGRLYVFAAQNPPNPALLILDVTDL